MKRILVVFFFLFATISISQNAIKIKHPDNYSANCFIELCIDQKCYLDSIPQKLFFSENNIELRFNDDCTVKKKSDVFVSAFEIWSGSEANSKYAASSSSFMNSSQKNLIQKIKINNTFYIKNITFHSPDGFRKIDSLQFKIY